MGDCLFLTETRRRRPSNPFNDSSAVGFTFPTIPSTAATSGKLGLIRKRFASTSKRTAPPCGKDENPAEWILRLVGTGGSSVDWPGVWRQSPESEHVRNEIEAIHRQHGKMGKTSSTETVTEFAMPFPEYNCKSLPAVLEDAIICLGKTPAWNVIGSVSW